MVINASHSSYLHVLGCNYKNGFDTCGNMEVYCPTSPYKSSSSSACKFEGASSSTNYPYELDSVEIHTEDAFNDLDIGNLLVVSSTLYCGAESSDEYSCELNEDGNACKTHSKCDYYPLTTSAPTEDPTVPPTATETVEPTESPSVSETVDVADAEQHVNMDGDTEGDTESDTNQDSDLSVSDSSGDHAKSSSADVFYYAIGIILGAALVFGCLCHFRRKNKALQQQLSVPLMAGYHEEQPVDDDDDHVAGTVLAMNTSGEHKEAEHEVKLEEFSVKDTALPQEFEGTLYSRDESGTVTETVTAEKGFGVMVHAENNMAAMHEESLLSPTAYTMTMSSAQIDSHQPETRLFSQHLVGVMNPLENNEQENDAHFAASTVGFIDDGEQDEEVVESDDDVVRTLQ